MENLVKKLEEQITFLQQEMSQMSNELYFQQKEISKIVNILVSEIRIFQLQTFPLNNKPLTTIPKSFFI